MIFSSSASSPILCLFVISVAKIESISIQLLCMLQKNLAFNLNSYSSGMVVDRSWNRQGIDVGQLDFGN